MVRRAAVLKCPLCGSQATEKDAPVGVEFAGAIACARGGPPGCHWRVDRRIVRRMPRLQVYLPDDLHDELKRRGLPASELLQIALRAELERQNALDATSDYLDELAAEVGEPTSRHQAHAEVIARRIRERGLERVG